LDNTSGATAQTYWEVKRPFWEMNISSIEWDTIQAVVTSINSTMMMDVKICNWLLYPGDNDEE